MSTNKTLRLPSGTVAVRLTGLGGGTWYRLHGAPVALSAADVEALFADSIAGDGGTKLSGDCLALSRGGGDRTTSDRMRCVRSAGHSGPHVGLTLIGAPGVWSR